MTNRRPGDNSDLQAQYLRWRDSLPAKLRDDLPEAFEEEIARRDRTQLADGHTWINADEVLTSCGARYRWLPCPMARTFGLTPVLPVGQLPPGGTLSSDGHGPSSPCGTSACRTRHSRTRAAWTSTGSCCSTWEPRPRLAPTRTTCRRSSTPGMSAANSSSRFCTQWMPTAAASSPSSSPGPRPTGHRWSRRVSRSEPTSQRPT